MYLQAVAAAEYKKKGELMKNTWTCINCNTENHANDKFCINCGTARLKLPDNHCSNPKCAAYNVILSNPEQKYCGKCGAATVYWKEIEDMC